MDRKPRQRRSSVPCQSSRAAAHQDAPQMTVFTLKKNGSGSRELVEKTPTKVFVPQAQNPPFPEPEIVPNEVIASETTTPHTTSGGCDAVAETMSELMPASFHQFDVTHSQPLNAIDSIVAAPVYTQVFPGYEPSAHWDTSQAETPHSFAESSSSVAYGVSVQFNDQRFTFGQAECRHPISMTSPRSTAAISNQVTTSFYPSKMSDGGSITSTPDVVNIGDAMNIVDFAEINPPTVSAPLDFSKNPSSF